MNLRIRPRILVTIYLSLSFIGTGMYSHNKNIFFSQNYFVYFYSDEGAFSTKTRNVKTFKIPTLVQLTFVEIFYRNDFIQKLFFTNYINGFQIQPRDRN